MCDVTTSGRRVGPPRPRWLRLYGLVLLLAGAFAAIESIGASGAQTVLQCALATAGVASIGQWVRRNRSALDLQEWCACAGEQVSMRVIHSRRPGPDRNTASHNPAPALDLALTLRPRNSTAA